MSVYESTIRGGPSYVGDARYRLRSQQFLNGYATYGVRGRGPYEMALPFDFCGLRVCYR